MILEWLLPAILTIVTAATPLVFAAVGEAVVSAAELAGKRNAPLIAITASGGARMQEGLVSLMQMAKTSSALGELRESGLPYLTVLSDPTTGGVSASLGTLGDIIIAEPKALIGFAGPRVIEQTVGQVLPEGFQRSEFLLKHGAIDMIVERKELRERIAKIVALLTDKMSTLVLDPAINNERHSNTDPKEVDS